MRASLKRMPLDKNRIAKRVAFAAGFFLLCAVPALTGVQSSPSGTVQTPHMASPAALPKKSARPTDDFAGLNFTDDQKAKIEQIHKNTKARLDAVAKDEKLTPDQKEAMLEGFRRMERGEIFKILTPEQQKEVRERVKARRAAEQEGKKRLPPPH